MRFGRTIGILAGVILSAGAVRAGVTDDRAGVEYFEKHVRPILADRCYSCHSASAPKLKAGLRLDSWEGMSKGGESGTPAVVGGKPDDSLMVSAVHWEDGGLQMPPKAKLKPEQISAIEAWVRMGAPYPKATSVAAANTKATTPPPTVIRALTVDQGRAFWSFQRPVESAVPEGSGWGRNEVDRFVLAKLKEKGLTPSPQADRRTLLRRVTYDLTGLPPTADEVAAFENDRSADAYEKVVDRLLASPHYGERWGRYWLDVARYADTKGYVFEEERRYAYSYTYRDWVIRAMNEDLPYDEFLVRQIAADRELKEDAAKPAAHGRSVDRGDLAALGFLTLGRRFLNSQPDIIDDRIDVVMRGTQALTVACARCHDHKFDPIPTADYYSLYGVFASSREPAAARELPVIGEAPDAAQRAAYEAELKKREDERDAWVARRFAEVMAECRSAGEVATYLLAAQRELGGPGAAGIAPQKEVRPVLVGRWKRVIEGKAEAAQAGAVSVMGAWRAYAALPAEPFGARAAVVALRASVDPSVNPLVRVGVGWRGTPASLADVAARYAAVLAKWDRADAYADAAPEAVRRVMRGNGAATEIALTQADEVFNVPDGQKRRQLQRAIDEVSVTHPGSPPRGMVLEDLPQPVQPHVFKRGNAGNPGDAVPRRFLAVLSPPDRKPFTDGSGRLELARAIASRDNPLTARVMVNRVWQGHFGFGLVRTPSDFGTRGERPTHPELLDWLAAKFESDDGWSLKKLHRRIVLSATYRQASLDRPDARAVDPENRLVWRQNARRLDFEAMRDSMLVASGAIDPALGGRPIDLFAKPFSHRRSVYAYIDRQNLPGTFRTFDFASPDSTSGQRFNTTVPQQALYMMNGAFAIEQAKKVAGRKDVAAESDPAKRVDMMYRTVLGRDAAADEVATAVKFVAAEQADAQPAEAVATANKAWQYGYGAVDEPAQKLATFTKMPHFGGSAWQGGGVLPDRDLGWAMLSAAGGHPGDLKHAVVRRWVAPRDCTIAISGELEHDEKDGDGVRARVVTANRGVIGMWVVHHSSAKTELAGVDVKAGETVDFVVDCGRADNFYYDSFAWAVRVKKQGAAVAGDDAGRTWDSTKEFTAADAGRKPLTPWEKLAQVLLESNEFVFVD